MTKCRSSDKALQSPAMTRYLRFDNTVAEQPFVSWNIMNLREAIGGDCKALTKVHDVSRPDKSPCGVVTSLLSSHTVVASSLRAPLQHYQLILWPGTWTSVQRHHLIAADGTSRPNNPLRCSSSTVKPLAQVRSLETKLL
jgi:hypothetical protein